MRLGAYFHVGDEAKEYKKRYSKAVANNFKKKLHSMESMYARARDW
jgi:hypothetical protein